MLAISASQHPAIGDAAERLATGHPILVVGSSAAEVIAPARNISTAAVRFMVCEAGGILRVVVSPARAAELALTPIRSTRANGTETRCVNVEARDGVTTGISAADRARTIGILGSEQADARDLVSPGHIVPLIGELHGRTMHTSVAEAAIVLCRSAGVGHAAAVCHLLTQAGGLADACDAVHFARRHGLALLELSGADNVPRHWRTAA
jgi:3,4-dihydroxy-2-butanone 4-phosphate synthase